MKNEVMAMAVLLAVGSVGCGQRSGPGGGTAVPPPAGGDGVAGRGSAPRARAEAPLQRVRLGDGKLHVHGGPTPPRVGPRARLAFAPPSRPADPHPAAEAPPLKVRRVHPRGPVSKHNAITVSFNQPMVPLAALADLRKLPTPLQVRPAVKGRHRWLGTRTLALETRQRLPYSTRFCAEVPAGARAESGQTLAQGVRWEFETPRLQAGALVPSGSRVAPDSAFALQLNQGIDADKVFSELRIVGPGDPPALRRIPRQQWAQLGSVGEAALRWKRNRVLVVRPVRPLRGDTKYSFWLDRGLVAGEGPLPTRKPVTWDFSTYGPLRVRSFKCGARREPCRPRTFKRIRFTNRIRLDGATEHIRIHPPVKGFRPRCGYNYCNLRGEFRPQTRYTVTVGAGMRDVYDQELGTPWQRSFHVGDAAPRLALPTRSYLGVTEWRGDRALRVRSVNVRGVTAHLVRVKPAHVPHALRVIRKRRTRRFRRFSMAHDVPGTLITRQLRLNRRRNRSRTTAVPLDLNLPHKKPGLLFVELHAPVLRSSGRYARPYRRMLVQVTDLALTVRYDVDRILTLVTGLSSGEPVAGAEVILYSATGKELWRGRTGASGLAEAPGVRALRHQGPVVVVARQGDDAAVAALRGGGQQGHVRSYVSRRISYPPQRRLRAHLALERNPHRPGETLHLMGTLRVEEMTPTGGISALRGEGIRLRYWIHDARRRLVVKDQTLAVDEDGAFHLRYRIPEGAALGRWRFRAELVGGEMSGKRLVHTFQVLQYRTPDYEVEVEARGAPHFFGDRVSATVTGRYLHGVAMADAPVRWTLRRERGAFRPPRHAGFSFGELRDWVWRWRSRRGPGGGASGSRAAAGSRHARGEIVARGEGALNDEGRLRVEAGLPFWECAKAGPGQPEAGQGEQAAGQGKQAAGQGKAVAGQGKAVAGQGKTDGVACHRRGAGQVGAFTLEAQVLDENRQAIAGRQTLVVHPAAVYVGLRMKKRLVRAGTDATVQVVVTDHAGARQAGHRVQVVATSQVPSRTAVKKEGRWQYRYSLEEQVVGTCRVTSVEGITGCRLRLPEAGYYRLRAEARDARGRRTRTVLGVYAVGKRHVPWRHANQRRLELVPDAAEYQPGDTARVLIKSPFRRAVGLLTVERKGIRSHRVIRLDSSVHAETIRLRGTDLPNVHVSVALVRGRVALVRGRVALMRGRVAVPGTADAADANRDLGRPRFAHGVTTLKVSRREKRLRVEVRVPRDPARPGAKAPLRIRVTDAAGNPVRARLAVTLADEGVLSLLGYRVRDPLALFHDAKPAWAALRDLRADLLKQSAKSDKRRERSARSRRRAERGAYRYVKSYWRNRSTLTADQVMLTERAVATGGAIGGKDEETEADDGRRAARAKAPPPVDPAPRKGRGPTAVKLSFATRARFAATAFFDGGVTTDADGEARVPVTLPENLTTFRITAVAADRDRADRFGLGEARLTVRQPLMLQPSLPRFANYGDRFEAAVKVTNDTGRAGEVTVRLRADARRVRPTGATTRRVQLASGQTAEVRFPVRVVAPGRARLGFRAHLGRETDAVAVALPVHVPATTEAFATYGVTEGTVAQTVAPPADALPGFGGLSLSFSSTALTGLEDAVRYLVDYPYECTEQTASRLIPIFSLRRILPAFRLLGQRTVEGDRYVVKLPERFTKAHPGKPRAALERAYLEWLARQGLAKLASHQRYDGGFGYHGGSRQSWPYPTAYALLALLRGRAAGYDVSTWALGRAARWLARYLHRRSWWRRYGPRTAWPMRAMAAWLLSELRGAGFLSGATRRSFRLAAALDPLYAHRERLPLYAKAMLAQALYRVEGRSTRVRALLQALDNAAIVDTPNRAHFRERADESLRLLMHSSSRTDAIVLGALMEVQPDHPLVPRVVAGLMGARVRGRWETTQANAYALMALSRYYARYERQTPDYRLRLWVGEGFVGQTRFAGRSLRVAEARVPLAALRSQGEKPPLVLQKTGVGKLYYRLGLRYAPRSLRLDPAEQGLSVLRTYEPIGDPGDVVRLTSGRTTAPSTSARTSASPSSSASASGTPAVTAGRAPAGRWRIAAGAYVRVRLRVVVPSRRYFVALDDPLPAGLEAVDLKLRTSAFSALAGQAGRRPSTAGRLYRRFPASHREKRDDRVVLLADRLPAGVYEYTYLARATTVGTFVVPPLEASEMYHPEVFGRSGTAIVQVRESAEAKAKAKESAEAKAKAKESDEAKAKAKESDEAKGSGGPAQP